MADFQKFHDSNSAGDDLGLDGRIQAALHDVPIPEGLAARLQAALVAGPARVQSTTQNATIPTAVIANTVNENTVNENSVNEDTFNENAVTANTRTSNARTLQADIFRRSAIVLALAGALAGFAILANQWRQPLERTWLEAHAQAILERWENQNLADLDTSNLSLPSAIQQQLARVKLVGSLPLSSLGSKLSGTLYRLEASDGRGIVLLKLAHLPPIRGLSGRFSPLNSPSGGWSLAAVTVNSETYVLAAVGTEQQLFNYIHRPAVT